MVKVSQIAAFLDQRLRVADFRDDSHNGLQVQNSGRVKHICAGVDASQEFFEAAAARGAQLLICHHGLSWGDSLRRITGLNYQRLKFLIEHDMALYACHLPLDAHPQLGNNARICRVLGLRKRQPFGVYRGMTIGFRGELAGALALSEFEKLVAQRIGAPVRSMAFGKKRVRTVAVVSGGASDLVEEAATAGVDVFLSGEPQLQCWSLAQEHRINALFAGHYATETFGVQAVTRLLLKHFGLTGQFIDLQVPY